MNNFKKIIRIALAKQWMNRDSFYDDKVQFESVEREFLNEEEVKTLVEKGTLLRSAKTRERHVYF